ncbi:4a-hydroxytetrahydrobiopterin dehydratase [Agaribacterium haliotis]|uniref:4a-hydroxytetrahydrobiopterin dehydratase n=1 Tax=Agaribacterium haliotis TaxID=2013869 RepID=UPI000BB54F1D|nr:4a-hydroxytetrahydrobiopterin dehydratase [Agaribacterium haliotis]
MSELTESKCEACRVGAPRLSQQELTELLPGIADWYVVHEAGVAQLCRRFDFKDFAEAQAFTNAVAELAEKEAHHPALLLEWGRVTVRWWTHKIEGLHKNDVIMAAKTDLLYNQSSVS